MNKVRWFAITAVTLALIAIASYGAGGGIAQQPAGTPCPSPMATPGASPEAMPIGSPEASPMASPAADGCPVYIEGNDDFRFVPDEITIAADTDVEITFANVGVLPHNFTVDELDFQIVAEPGSEQSATLNVPAGTYEFYCSVPGHRESGMVGTLIVE